MSVWTSRCCLSFLLLLTYCAKPPQEHEPPSAATLYLTYDQSAWTIESQRLPDDLKKGDLLYVQHHAPLPGSDIQPPIALARFSGNDAGTPQVDLIYSSDTKPPSQAGLNPMIRLGAEDTARVENYFGESVPLTKKTQDYIAPSQPMLILNLGALDGAFVNARYTILDRDNLSPLGSCKIPSDGLFKTHSWCKPDPQNMDLGKAYFVSLLAEDQPMARLSAIHSASDPCPIPLDTDFSLESLERQQACTLLNKAYLDFSERFGAFGQGGRDGIYLDQRYKDPNFMPSTLDDEWVVPEEQARLALRAQAWLKKEDQKALVIFGSIAAGKGTFAQRCAYDIASETLLEGQGLIPLRVSLDKVLKEGETLAMVDGVTLIARAMEGVLKTEVSRELLQKDLEQFRILPIFDKFDEVSLDSTVVQALEHYHNLVSSAAPGQGRLILMSRSSNTLGEPLAGLTLAIDQEVQAAPDQTQLYLQPLTPEVVEDYLYRLAPDDELRERTMASIHRAFDMDTLANTPILVFLVSNYLANHDGAEMPSDIYSLYRLYSSLWTERVLGAAGMDERGWEHFLRRCVAMGLALDQWQQKDISEAELQSFISNNSWLLAPLDAGEAWNTAIDSARGGAFITRNSEGRYQFIDRSFQQYFASEGLIQALIFVWRDEPANWSPSFILGQFLGLRPSEGTIRFLREGMGPDPYADRGIHFLLENAPDSQSAVAFFQMRVLRQRLADPTEPALGDVIARRSRFTFHQLYQEENERLQQEAMEGALALLATSSGERYEAVPGEPWIVRDIKEGSLWAYIPAGTFFTGDGLNELRKVSVDEPYLLSVFETTNAQFRDFYFGSLYTPHAFLRSGQAVPFLDSWPEARLGGEKGLHFPDKLANYPVVAVSWRDVVEFFNWRNSRNNAPFERPPNEAEWELAARGLMGRYYPWGDAFETDRVQLSLPEADEVLLPVDSLPLGRSPLGLYHMAGNASEWVLPSNADNIEINGTLRGGSNLSQPTDISCFYSLERAPSPQLRLRDAGFRIRRALPRSILKPQVLEEELRGVR